MKKKIIASVIALALVIILIVLAWPEAKKALSGSVENDTISQTLVTSSNVNRLVALPKAYVNADATTTDASLEFSGVVNQMVQSNGLTAINVNAKLKGGTATSTFAIRPLVSPDCVNYYFINSSSTPAQASSATTTLSVDINAYQVDPGTATTSKSWLIAIPPSQCTRLEFWGENVSTDPSDGVNAFIQVSFVK